MSEIDYTECAYPVRDGLVQTQRETWAAIARPGTWLDGAQRVAAAAEARNARACGVCKLRKDALSPYSIEGEHDAGGELGAGETDLVHRLTTDPGRLSGDWCQALLDGGVEDGVYVEIVGIVSSLLVVDTFTRALGLELFPLPEPEPGAPSGHRPRGAAMDRAWVALLKPEDVDDADGEVYPAPRVSYVQMALSLVPQTKRDYWALVAEHYLSVRQIGDFGAKFRAITRSQIELIAARVASLHQCVY